MVEQSPGTLIVAENETVVKANSTMGKSRRRIAVLLFVKNDKRLPPNWPDYTPEETEFGGDLEESNQPGS